MLLSMVPQVRAEFSGLRDVGKRMRKAVALSSSFLRLDA